MEKKQVESIINKYFDDCIFRKRLNVKTIRAYKIDLNDFMDFGDYEINGSKRIVDYIHHLNKKYDKPKTVKRKIASVRAFYNFLEYENIIENNVFRKIRTDIKEPKLLPKIIANSYIHDILSYLYKEIINSKTEYKKVCSVRNAALIELMFATGIRVSELCNIRYEDINFEERTLKIFGKGSKERMLYIGNDEVIKILKKYENMVHQDEKNEFFFISKFKEKLSEQSVRIILTELESKLDLPTHITPHMFRHTFATNLLEKDVDIRYIQKILGHSSISVTQIYTHVSYPKQKEILTIKNPRNDYSILEN